MEPEIIKNGGKILAVIVRKDSIQDTLRFVTPPSFPLQIGYHNQLGQKRIGAHEHLPFIDIDKLENQEFFFVISGKVKVDIYFEKKKFTKVVINSGDSIILNCGHGFEFVENTKMVEVKQGPYRSREGEKIDIDDDNDTSM